MVKNKHYEVLIAAVLIFGLKLLVLLLWEKQTVHLAINGWNGTFRDEFFYFLTYAGDGLFALAVILLALFVRFRYALLLSIAYLGSALVVQLMKHLLFAETMRPVRYFQELGIDLNLVEKVHHHSYMSFPSGHSASAYAIFISLALLVKNKMLSVVLVFIAATVAFSRVYLSQHFLLDTLVGGVIGFVFAWVFYCWQQKWSAAWLNKSLLNLKTR